MRQPLGAHGAACVNTGTVREARGYRSQLVSHAYIRSLVSNQPVGNDAGPSGAGSAPFSTVPGI